MDDRDIHRADEAENGGHPARSAASLVSREAITYGVFEIVARLPQGGGQWPAIWLLHEGSPYGEIDVVEAISAAPGKAWTTFHAGRDVHSLKDWQAQTMAPDIDRAFHLYRLEWRKDLVRVTIDGREALKLNPDAAKVEGLDPLRAPMHLRINLALGGSWGGKVDDAALPASLEIKSIKIWSAL